MICSSRHHNDVFSCSSWLPPNEGEEGAGVADMGFSELGDQLGLGMRA